MGQLRYLWSRLIFLANEYFSWFAVNLKCAHFEL